MSYEEMYNNFSRWNNPQGISIKGSKKQKRKYLHKLTDKLGSSVASPNREKRSREYVDQENKLSLYDISLSDQIYEHVDHTYLRNPEVLSSNPYTPDEPTPLKSDRVNNLYRYDAELSHEKPASINRHKTSPYRYKYGTAKDYDEEYTETMEELTEEILGVPVKNHKNKFAQLPAFKAKPQFPNEIIA